LKVVFLVNLRSLFGQFHNDTLFFIPIRFIYLVLILSFFWLFPIKVGPVVGYACIMGHNVGQKFFLGFMFRDAEGDFYRWVLFLYALKTTLVMVKVTGLIPYSLTFTSHVSFTYSLAFPMWASMQFVGFIYFFNHRVSHFLPSGTPWPLVPLMVVIEFVGLFIQPIALGLRLAANITAGHLLIYLFSVAVWRIMEVSLVVSMVFLVVLFLLFLLEIGVAMIQAYVFVALLSFFYRQKVEH